MANTKKKVNSTFIAAFIPASVALNIVMGVITEALKLPIFLNNMGSFVAVIVINPTWGIISAFLTNLILGLTVRWSSFFPGVILPVMASVSVSVCYKLGMLNKLWKQIVSGVITGIICGIVYGFMTAIMSGGFGGTGHDLITAGLMLSGLSMVASVFITGVGTMIADKVICLFIALQIIRIFPNRLLPNAEAVKQSLGMEAKSVAEDEDI